MTGDGLLATFDGPARAVTWAAAIGRAVRTLGLAVRAAVHTGEVELRDSDIGGIAVHIASRVMGLAHPNEVLVSSTVKDLVAGAEIRFEDRSVQSLRGGARPVAPVRGIHLTWSWLDGESLEPTAQAGLSATPRSAAHKVRW